VKLPEDPIPVPAGISDCQLQSFADDGMLNLLDAIDFFELGIFDDDAGTEILIDSDVNA
jgi:hypothetical protein